METQLASFKRVLCLAPHTDDEMGCAGTLARLKRSGATIKYVCFSACEESLPNHPPDTLRHECAEMMRRLGIDGEIGTLRVRCFPEVRQQILESLVAMREWPDLVLTPCSDDAHQDHRTVYEESVRAFRCTILGYELPQNLRTYHNAAWIRLEPRDMERKIEALAAYASQSDRPYAGEDFIRSLARVRGLQAGCEYAESYEVIRWIA